MTNTLGQEPFELVLEAVLSLGSDKVLMASTAVVKSTGWPCKQAA
jgi:hypothetical protein